MDVLLDLVAKEMQSDMQRDAARSRLVHQALYPTLFDRIIIWTNGLPGKLSSRQHNHRMAAHPASHRHGA